MIRGSEKKKKIKRAPLKEGQRPIVFDINQTFHSMAYKTDKLQKSIKKKDEEANRRGKFGAGRNSL